MILIGRTLISLAYLVGHTEIGRDILVVHLYGGRTWTLRLVSYLNLTLANLDSRRILISDGLLGTITDLGKPLS